MGTVSSPRTKACSESELPVAVAVASSINTNPWKTIYRVGSSVRSESGLSVAVVDSINMGDASSLGHVPHQPQLAPRFALHVEQLPIEQQGKS